MRLKPAPDADPYADRAAEALSLAKQSVTFCDQDSARSRILSLEPAGQPHLPPATKRGNDVGVWC